MQKFFWRILGDAVSCIRAASFFPLFFACCFSSGVCTKYPSSDMPTAAICTSPFVLIPENHHRFFSPCLYFNWGEWEDRRALKKGEKAANFCTDPAFQHDTEGIIRQFRAIRHPYELIAVLQCPVCQAVRANGTDSGCFALWTPPLCWVYILQASRNINISHMQILC